MEFLLPPLINLIQNSAKVRKGLKISKRKILIFAYLAKINLIRLSGHGHQWPCLSPVYYTEHIQVRLIEIDFQIHNTKFFRNQSALPADHLSTRVQQVERDSQTHLRVLGPGAFLLSSFQEMKKETVVKINLINQLLHSWPTHSLEKHVAILQEVGFIDIGSQSLIDI